MQIERTDLIEKIETVKPALSSTRIVPIMQHVWFTGEDMLAYNSQIAVSIPFKTDFKGAVLESALLGLLKASRAKTLELLPDGEHLAVRAPKIRSNLRLPLLPPDQFVFEMPRLPPVPLLMPTEKEQAALKEALKICLTSVSNDATVPDQLGVTVIPDKDRVLMYSTNFMSLVQSTVKLSGLSMDKRVILPKAFAQQVVKWAEGFGMLTVHIDDEYALCHVKKNDVIFFGRLIESEHPLDFKKLVGDILPKDYQKQLSPIPNKMRLVLDRAAVICNSSTDNHASTIRAKKGTLYIESKSVLGEVADQMNAGEYQPDVTVRVEPGLLRSACDLYDDYLLSDRAAIMSRPDSLYLVAARQKETSKVVSVEDRKPTRELVDDDIPF